MTQKLIYLASPYSHTDPLVRIARYEAVCKAAAVLMAQGHFVFSPIAHTHGIAYYGEMETGFDYWKELDELMIRKCDELWVLKIPGWCQSNGVNAEVAYATELGMPIVYLEWTSAP